MPKTHIFSDVIEFLGGPPAAPGLMLLSSELSVFIRVLII